jgi:hypothetical protein
MKRYRLTARAEMHGEVREPGYIFTLADGEIGPHRAVNASSHGAQIADHLGPGQELIDEPLYEEVVDDPHPKPEDAPTPSADAEVRKELEAEKAKNAELEAKLANLKQDLA